MAQLTVGLDLGNESLKRVRLKSSFRAVELVDYTEVELAQDDRPFSERVAEALTRIDGSGQAELVATALPGNVVSVRNLELPFTDSKRISQTIGFELESQIPFSLDRIVFDYLQLAKTNKGTSLMMAALCQLDQMQRWLDTLQSAGMDPRLVGADCLAYSSLADYLPQPAEGTRQAIIDIGHRLTSVCVLGPNGVEFGRTLSFGGQDATGRLAEAFGIDEEEAMLGKHRGAFVETASRSAATPEQVLISDTLRKSVDMLVRELRQTLTTHRSLTGQGIDQIWLCGRGAAVENLDEYLSEALDTDVQRLRPEHFDLEGIDKLAAGDDGETLAWVKALGLALHAHQGGRKGWLNLRRGPFAFKGDFDAVRGKVLHLAVALAFIGLLAIGQALVSYFSLRSTDRALDARIRETTQAILGKAYDNVDVAQSIIKEKISPEANPLPRFTALDGLREFHERVPAELRLRLRDINISPTRIRVEGFTEGFESVELLKAALEKVECFKEVQTGRTRKTKDESEVEFELTIVNGC